LERCLLACIRDKSRSSLLQKQARIATGSINHWQKLNKAILFFLNLSQQTTNTTCQRSSAASCRNLRNTNDSL